MLHGARTRAIGMDEGNNRAMPGWLRAVRYVEFSGNQNRPAARFTLETPPGSGIGPRATSGRGSAISRMSSRAPAAKTNSIASRVLSATTYTVPLPVETSLDEFIELPLAAGKQHLRGEPSAGLREFMFPTSAGRREAIRHEAKTFRESGPCGPELGSAN